MHNFSRIIFKCSKDIYYPKISEMFDNGGSASLNSMLFNEPAEFGIPGRIFQVKTIKFGTNVGLNMLLRVNISSGFYHRCNVFGDFFTRFPTSRIENHR